MSNITKLLSVIWSLVIYSLCTLYIAILCFPSITRDNHLLKVWYYCVFIDSIALCVMAITGVGKSKDGKVD